MDAGLAMQMRPYVKYLKEVLGLSFVSLTSGVEHNPSSSDCALVNTESLDSDDVAVYLVDLSNERETSLALRQLADRLESAIKDEWVRQWNLTAQTIALGPFALRWIESSLMSSGQCNGVLPTVLFGAEKSPTGAPYGPEELRIELPRLSELLVSPPLKRKAWTRLQAAIKVWVELKARPRT